MSNGGSKRDRWRDETFEPKRLGQEGGAGKRVIGKSRGGGRRLAIFRLIGRKKETLYRSRRRRRWPRNRTTGSVHRSGKLEGGPGALTPARCRCWSGSAFLPGPICRGWSSRDVPPAVSSIHVTADKISPAPPKAMKITLEFVGWLDERLYSRAVCGLLEKRAICPPLEAERNFERRERGGGRGRGRGSQSIELLDAGFHVCFTCCEFRTSNSSAMEPFFSFFLQFIFILVLSPNRKFRIEVFIRLPWIDWPS